MSNDEKSITELLWGLPSAPPRRKKRAGPPLEKAIQANVEKALNLLPGVYVERNATGAVRTEGRFVRFGKPGQGDLGGWVTVLGAACVLEVEVKRPGNPHPQTPLQKRRQERILGAGGCYLLVHSATEAIDELAAWRARAEAQLRAQVAGHHEDDCEDCTHSRPRGDIDEVER